MSATSGLRWSGTNPPAPAGSQRVAWVDLALVPDPRAWLTERLGPLSRFEVVEPAVSPELAAARAMATMTDADRLALRATLRPSPPEYRDGGVPLVPGGYGDLPRLFPGMKPTKANPVSDVVTIRAIGLTVDPAGGCGPMSESHPNRPVLSEGQPLAATPVASQLQQVNDGPHAC